MKEIKPVMRRVVDRIGVRPGGVPAWIVTLECGHTRYIPKVNNSPELECWDCYWHGTRDDDTSELPK